MKEHIHYVQQLVYFNYKITQQNPLAKISTIISTRLCKYYHEQYEMVFPPPHSISNKRNGITKHQVNDSNTLAKFLSLVEFKSKLLLSFNVEVGGKRGLIRSSDQYYCQILLSYGQTFARMQVIWYHQTLHQGTGIHLPNSHLVILVLSNKKVL